MLVEPGVNLAGPFCFLSFFALYFFLACFFSKDGGDGTERLQPVPLSAV